MKPVLIRAWARESVLFALALLSAQAQSAQTDLTSLQIENLMNLAWQPSDKMSWGLLGQNFLQGLPHEQSGSVLMVTPGLVHGSAYTRLTWRF